MAERKVAFVFPGQGSQYVGMGRKLYESSDEIKALFDLADDVLGFKLSELCFHGPEDKLKLTENTQPAILLVSITAYKYMRMKNNDIKPCFVSGHSLGEYSALVASESLRLEDALRLVRARGKYMQEAVPVGEGAMAAILGAEDSLVEEVCSEIIKNFGYVAPANYNSPGQIVISGKSESVNKAIEVLKSKGVKRAILLPVSAPFHSELMLEAGKKLERDFERVTIKSPKISAISNVTGKPYENENDIRKLLIEQLTKPVKWVDCVRYMYDNGVRDFVEIGPGKVLSGLIKRICEDANVYSIEHPLEIESFLENFDKEKV
ncbi:MAG: ACP S-malonyltransferase [Proteobacteria bacterium]|nr:ACP S-malonyltransferase [Pseudomonadota bacterium]